MNTITIDELFRGVGILIDIKQNDNFLKIKETLTRIGVSSKEGKTLYQSCHILHKTFQGQSYYALVHFKEMFILDRKPSTLTEEDINRRDTIANLLEDWELLIIQDRAKRKSDDVVLDMSSIRIIPFSKKREWDLVSKYTVGKKDVPSIYQKT